MTKMTLGLLALGGTLLTAGLLSAQSPAAPAGANAAGAPKQPKLVKVCTLSTVQANQEFQANVQVMQNERQQVIDANAAYEMEPDAAKRKELKTKVDTLLAKLNEDNQRMIKAYGFSLEHAYSLEVEKASVYMLVSEEEAAKIEQAQAEAARKK